MTNTKTSTSKKNTVRITKLISDCGITSRRGAEKLIAEGEVIVNGKIITDPGFKADFETDSIKVFDKLITRKESKVYYLFHKPPKCVATLYDTKERATIANFINRIKSRVLPVGTLTYEAAGVIILTNDGELIKTLTSKSTPITKTYKLKISGIPAPEIIQKLHKRLKSTDTNPQAVKVRFSQRKAKNSWIEITVGGITNKQIEQIFMNTGFPIQKWVKLKMGAISLSKLGPGTYRSLTSQEIKYLKSFMKKKL